MRNPFRRQPAIPTLREQLDATLANMLIREAERAVDAATASGDHIRTSMARGVLTGMRRGDRFRRHTNHDCSVTVDIGIDTSAFDASMARVADTLRRIGMAAWNRPSIRDDFAALLRRREDRQAIRAIADSERRLGAAYLTALFQDAYADLGLPYVPANITLGDN
jgi:hypothetical protein